MLENGKKVIGICIGGIDEEYNGDFLNSFSKYAASYDFKLITFYAFTQMNEGTTNDQGEGYVFDLMNYDLIDGIVLMSETIKSQRVIDLIMDCARVKNIPIVSVDRFIDGCYNVSFNYDKAMEDITRHLIEVHHFKVFNFIAGIENNEFSDRRLNVFRSVLREYNLELDERRLGYGGFWGRPTKEVMEKFLSSDLPLPDAFVCANDTMAATVFDCLRDAGIRVPEDVAVTGFDGISYALNHQPVITTAAHDIDRTAIETFDLFTRLFEGLRCNKRKWVDSHMIIGGTCGCPSKQSRFATNKLIEQLSDRINVMTFMNQNQVKMVTDLTDNDTFMEIFENLKRYVELFNTKLFMVCVDDVFLIENEIDDIIKTTRRKKGYSSKMDLMIYRHGDTWKGIIDFPTINIIPEIDQVFDEFDSIVVFPMHVHDEAIGYAILDFEHDVVNYNILYEFLMNLSTALELKKNYMLQRKFIQSLEDKYIHDHITGLLNRRGFYQEVNKVFEECIEEGSEFVIVSADLNRLKVINDTYGHSDGDLAIVASAHALKKAAINGEFCARFGGDEFIVAGKLREPDFEVNYRRRVKDYLDEYNAKSGKPYEITISMGVCTFVPTKDIDLDKRISVADELMYKEKVKAHMNRQ